LQTVELVALDESGQPDFNLIQNFRSAASRIHFFVFDLLIYQGRDLTRLSLIEITRVRFLCFDERQQPVFQVQMHVRRRVPLLKIVPLDAVLAKLGIAKPKLFFSQVTSSYPNRSQDFRSELRIVSRYFQGLNSR